MAVVQAENTLAIATGGVLIAAAILNERKQKQNGLVNTGERLWKKIIASILLVVVLTFTIEQAPEFGGPFALLILVAALVGNSGVFSDYFKETQS